MKYIYYINGEERMPTQEEGQILLDRLMEGLGYERIDKKKNKNSFECQDQTCSRRQPDLP